MGEYSNDNNGWYNGRSFSTTDRSFPFSPSMGQFAAQFFENNGKVVWRNTNSPLSIMAAFAACSPINSIVSKKSDAFSNGQIKVISRTTGKEVIGKDKDWIKLMAQPNPIQSGMQFRRQLYSFVHMYGYCYVLPVYPVGFKDRPSALWILPPWHVVVRRYPKTGLMPGEVEREIVFTWMGNQSEFKEKDLILFTNGNSLIDENTWLPRSRANNLEFPINNIVGTYDSIHTLIKHRGALGILSPDGQDSAGYIPIQPDEQEAIQNDYRRYGLTGDQWQLLISSAAVKWQPMTMKVKDMMLYEGKRDAIEDICDGMGYPYYLLSGGKSNTYNNADEAQKNLYQNNIIPESNDFFEQLNNGLKTVDNNIEIKISYEHIECLQESEAEASTGRKYTMEAMLIAWEMGNCTQDDILEARGEDRTNTEPNTLTKPFYDKWMRDNGIVEPPITLSETPESDLTALQKENNGNGTGKNNL